MGAVLGGAALIFMVQNQYHPACASRYAYPITCTGYTKDASGRVTEVQATYERDFKKPPKVQRHPYHEVCIEHTIRKR